MGWASSPVAVVSPPPPGSCRCYPCAECGEGFTQRSALSKHRHIHLGECPHQCGDCGKWFLQPSDLASHGGGLQRVAHGRAALGLP